MACVLELFSIQPRCYNESDSHAWLPIQNKQAARSLATLDSRASFYVFHNTLPREKASQLNGGPQLTSSIFFV